MMDKDCKGFSSTTILAVALALLKHVGVADVRCVCAHRFDGDARCASLNRPAGPLAFLMLRAPPPRHPVLVLRACVEISAQARPGPALCRLGCSMRRQAHERFRSHHRRDAAAHNKNCLDPWHGGRHRKESDWMLSVGRFSAMVMSLWARTLRGCGAAAAQSESSCPKCQT